MLGIRSIKENKKYLKEYFKLCSLEWGEAHKKDNFEDIINKKAENVLNGSDNNIILILGLFDNDSFIGFISLFKYDDNYEYTPWYATMYVKSEYRGKHYSKLLNDALINECKKLGYDKIYLKSELINYYEKFGAKYIKNLSDKEKLFYMDLKR